MNSTQYVVSVFLQKKEEAAYLAAIRHYNKREQYTREYHLEVVGTEDRQPFPPGKEQYVYVRLACTDVLALLKFGEYWGNKTMHRWEREREEQFPTTKGEPRNG